MGECIVLFVGNPYSGCKSDRNKDWDEMRILLAGQKIFVTGKFNSVAFRQV